MGHNKTKDLQLTLKTIVYRHDCHCDFPERFAGIINYQSRCDLTFQEPYFNLDSTDDFLWGFQPCVARHPFFAAQFLPGARGTMCQNYFQSISFTFTIKFSRVEIKYTNKL